MNSKWFAPVVIVAMLIFSAAVYNALPAQVPIHWNASGVADRYGDRLFGVLAMPVIALVCAVLIPTMRRLDPLRASYTSFEGTYRFLINLLVVFLGFVHVMSLGIALGWSINMSQVIGVALGLMFALLGNVLGRVRPNWFMGIRTPWTMSDPEVWRLTHRVGGRMMVVMGLVVMVVSLVLTGELAVIAMMITIFGTTGAILVYSYIAWRRLHPAA
ncbi:MAG: DUF1648 domain-containing protein [Anaerolineae bacterium]